MDTKEDKLKDLYNKIKLYTDKIASYETALEYNNRTIDECESEEERTILIDYSKYIESDIERINKIIENLLEEIITLKNAE